MTKTENRAAARACRREKSAGFKGNRQPLGVRPILKHFRIIRDYLIFKAKNRGDAHERLRVAIDDYADEITGDRTALHAKPASIGL